MTAATRAYLEHVAVRVRDIEWHRRFFAEVLGMTVREVDGPPDAPRQLWTLGGMQFIADPSCETAPTHEAGRLAHLGIMVEDLDASIAAATAFGARALPQGANWLELPDGLAVELIEAEGHSVQEALAVDPRGTGGS